ncbi:hypothetical protein AQ490_24365 [Wenjunlia vitaminophila]|uniref:D-isomer specific 2-hydroxyacid dehydrogenase NAD-binding domain-containing protein n=1 Tax=Wenjunlia vitaminophila TaxID=76728 RepID=A0A0T6LRB4_WENVI|nr:D-2-hydroxyacid dehydrogenase [Wenjunlia vitaminophila]KRV48670.1 hypothetical protein AQ490_24365 [Wenjunlia vitaminophila]
MRVYVQLALADGERERVRSLAGGGPVWFAEPGALTDDDARAFADAEVAVGNCPPEWVRSSERLRWLQLASVGVDAYLPLDWGTLGRRLTVTNLRGVFADPVAETCLAGVLAHLRGIDTLVRCRTTHTWDKLRLRPRLRLLTGTVVLVLGTGTISQRLCALLEPFGCTVERYGRTSGEIRTTQELEARLPSADVVVALLPDTPGTRGLLDARRLGLLKPGALFVNAGRGSVVDEEALVAALDSGRLGGAVLDVTQQEPLPDGHPLWDCPNTILTQHTAGGSDQEAARVLDIFTDNWRRYVGGEPLGGVVDWSLGY